MASRNDLLVLISPWSDASFACKIFNPVISNSLVNNRVLCDLIDKATGFRVSSDEIRDRFLESKSKSYLFPIFHRVKIF